MKVRFNMFFVLEPGIPVTSCTKDYVQINSTKWVPGALRPTLNTAPRALLNPAVGPSVLVLLGIRRGGGVMGPTRARSSVGRGEQQARFRGSACGGRNTWRGFARTSSSAVSG